jgi:AbrB family looped-hinge helix DNA binding protein
MSSGYIVTIDRAGRLVVPKGLREELGIEPGQPLTARVSDGRLEVEPVPVDVRLVERDGLLVFEPNDTMDVLTVDAVREALEATRR